MTEPRIALLGAFPFPAPLGSQHYCAEQARALVAAGARVTIFCYASGDGSAPERTKLVRAARALSPRAIRAGPNPAKLPADAALTATFLRDSRAEDFDAVLAHNVEAAGIALAVRALGGPPVVYVAHTLLGRELDSWVPGWFAGSARVAGACADRLFAARTDAVITLCDDAADALRPYVRGPLETSPPGHRAETPPTQEQQKHACERAGVTPGAFALYTGNVDRYQDLEVLAEAARRTPEIPVLVATHGDARFETPHVRCVRVMTEEARALAHACMLAIVTRRRPGGFPIKLLQYMEAGRAIVAREGIADGLTHDRDAWLVPRDAGPAAFARALHALREDPARRERLGRSACARLASHHDWSALANRSLALVDEARRCRRASRTLAPRSLQL